ncbi:hypothetical protein FACS189459_1510 [Bacilli bacterium]|nr:hypothetical protein FACS189459_1510 [Bacilli bacterium]
MLNVQLNIIPAILSYLLISPNFIIVKRLHIIAIDKIHTIDTKYLKYENKIGHIVKVSLEVRKQLLDFINEIIYSD